MTFNRFCKRNKIPFFIVAAFENWLGSTSVSKLPKGQWLILWKQFLVENVGGSDNGKQAS
jgi:hypothetical protein